MTVTPVDPGMMKFYEELSARTPPEAVNWPLAEQRRVWDDVCRAFRAPHPPGLTADDLDIDGVKVRLFRPQGGGLKPGVIYFHGGGWVLGSCETHDDMCAEMAAAAGAVVVLVDYRLAPEYRHPAQFEDAHTILAWMRKEGSKYGIDSARIVGAGDSAGGQMTASLALSLRDRGMKQLKGQVLIYPVLGGDMDTASYRRNAEAPCLTRADMKFYLEAFLGPHNNSNWRDPYAVPLMAASFEKLPPAFIAVAEHDPLMDDGVMFHERLRSAGVASQLRREPALAHSYMRARHVSGPAMEGFKAITAALRAFAHEGKMVSAAARENQTAL
ncbi:alpha/beta hydrolase [soil metagenome]